MYHPVYYYDYENAICNCVPVRALYAHFTSNNHLTKFINQIYGGKEHEQRRSMEPIDRLDRIVSEQDVCQIDEIITLIKAMGGLQHKRLFEVGDFFLQRCSYTFLPRYHNPGMAEAILDELMKLPRDRELDNYLIDFMVECESDLPTIGKKILGYL